MSLLSSMEATFPPNFTYTKSMDTHSFISYNTFHPRHIKQSIITVNFSITVSICSNDEIVLSDVTKLFKYFLVRQYPFSDILQHSSKVYIKNIYTYIYMYSLNIYTIPLRKAKGSSKILVCYNRNNKIC